MKNKLLAITRESVPYIPELKRKLKNTNATILMQQIEYWFHKKNGEAFYKFLAKPNKKNGFYKDGDSWCEELVFSEKEVRTAFSKLGISYNSKKAFEDVIEQEKNVFINEEGEEFFYCSYHDKIKGITFYYRNHKYTDNFLDELVKVETEELEALEIKGNPRKLPLGSYGDNQKEFTELPQGKSHITEITSEITTEDDDRSVQEDSENKKDQSELLKECYKLISKATGLNLERVKMCIAPNLLWKVDLQELVQAFDKSKYLKGGAEKKVPISTFGSVTQLNKVIGGFYEDRPEEKSKGKSAYKLPKTPDLIKVQEENRRTVKKKENHMTDLEKLKGELTKSLIRLGKVKVIAVLAPLKTMKQIEKFRDEYNL